MAPLFIVKERLISIQGGRCLKNSSLFGTTMSGTNFFANNYKQNLRNCFIRKPRLFLYTIYRICKFATLFCKLS